MPPQPPGVTPGSPAVLPGPIRQCAYLVPDLDAAMERWVGFGIGPWAVLRSLRLSGSVYRGQETAPVVSFAFANSGELQIELVHQDDNSPSLYREYAEAGRFGFHHVAFWTEDFTDTLARCADAGWPLLQRGNTGGFAEFAYLDAGGVTSPVVEVMELTEATRGLADLVRTASEGWDGREPVRPLQ